LMALLRTSIICNPYTVSEKSYKYFLSLAATIFILQPPSRYSLDKDAIALDLNTDRSPYDCVLTDNLSDITVYLNYNTYVNFKIVLHLSIFHQLLLL
jgi:hypothetical protein